MRRAASLAPLLAVTTSILLSASAVAGEQGIDAGATGDRATASGSRQLRLEIGGTSGEDVVELRLGPSGELVMRANRTIGRAPPPCENTGPNRMRCPRGSFDGIDASLLEGPDVLLARESFGLPIDVDGGAGDDDLIGGRGSDRLIGRTGEDELLGKAGDDEAYGGPGRDRLSGGTGADLLSGGPGIDLIEDGRGPDIVRP